MLAQTQSSSDKHRRGVGGCLNGGTGAVCIASTYNHVCGYESSRAGIAEVYVVRVDCLACEAVEIFLFDAAHEVLEAVMRWSRE